MRDKRTTLRILVTRSRRGKGRLRKKLEQAGFEVRSIPTIDFRVVDGPWAAQLSAPKRPWDLTIFTSRTTLEFMEEFIGRESIRRGKEVFGKIAVVGRSTARRVQSLGLSIDYQPERFDAEALLDTLDGHIGEGARIAIPRALDARELLPDTLDAWGADVHVLPVYEAFQPTQSINQLEQLTIDDIDLVTFASSNTVRYFEQLLTPTSEWLRGCPCACIGPITQATAEELGYSPIGTPIEASFEALTERIQRWHESVGG